MKGEGAEVEDVLVVVVAAAAVAGEEGWQAREWRASRRRKSTSGDPSSAFLRRPPWWIPLRLVRYRRGHALGLVCVILVRFDVNNVHDDGV